MSGQKRRATEGEILGGVAAAPADDQPKPGHFVFKRNFGMQYMSQSYHWLAGESLDPSDEEQSELISLLIQAGAELERAPDAAE